MRRALIGGGFATMGVFSGRVGNAAVRDDGAATRRTGWAGLHDQGGKRPENAQAAWLALALEVYRGHDRIFSTPVQFDQAYLKALRRLLDGLPALRGLLGNVYLEPADRAYVEDLVARLERFAPDARRGNPPK